MAGLLLALLTGCTSGGDPGDALDRDDATSSRSPSDATRPCAVAGFAPTERVDVRRGTRVVVYALRLDVAAGQRGRVPVTLRRLVDLRPGVRAPSGAPVAPEVLRRVASALPAGSTGPLSETFATAVAVPARPRAGAGSAAPRRLVAYAATRARPFAWTAEVCGPPTTADGSATEVSGTGLVLGPFATGRIDCARAEASTGRRSSLARQLLALC